MKPTDNADEFDMGFRGTEIIRTKNGQPIYAKTSGQQSLIDAIGTNDIIFVNGPSGTGKTAVATWLGIAGIDAGIYDRLVLTRPVVTTGEDIGFLPGTMNEKVAPYMQPLYDAISLIKGPRDSIAAPVEAQPELLSAKEKKRRRAAQKEDEARKTKNFYDLVQVCPLAFIRGSTLAHSFIVCDEFQNVTKAQMKTMLTRLGRGSKMVICGDSEQCDLPDRVESGFTHAMELLDGLKRVAIVNLGIDDIVRHSLIKSIIVRYERPSEERKLTREEEATRYVARTHTPGWLPEEDGIDFSEDIDDDEPSAEESEHQGAINADNERYAKEYMAKEYAAYLRRKK